MNLEETIEAAPPSALDTLAAAIQDGTFDPECDRCNYARHICPGCGTDLHHGLEVCSGCRSWLAAEQVETEEAIRLHQTSGPPHD